MRIALQRHGHTSERARRRRRRRIGTGAILAGALVLGVAAPASAFASRQVAHGVAPAATAYAYDNNPSAKNLTPEHDYTYNSSGGPVGITRSTVGQYTVTFYGLGSVTGGGTVDVTPEGNNSDAALCSVVSWAPDPTDSNLTVRVDCLQWWNM